MDNVTVATHPHTHETAVAAEHEHVMLPQHRHHFETQEQQREAGTFGMWLFLLTEIMFFGGLFMADRKSTRLNSSHRSLSRMPSSA